MELNNKLFEKQQHELNKMMSQQISREDAENAINKKYKEGVVAKQNE